MPPKTNVQTSAHLKDGPPTEPAAFSATTTLDQLMGMSVVMLREHLNERQLAHEGNKKVLAERLLEHLHNQCPAPEEPTPQPDNPPFTTVQQVTLKQVVKAALTQHSTEKGSSSTLSDPSTVEANSSSRSRKHKRKNHQHRR